MRHLLFLSVPNPEDYERSVTLAEGADIRLGENDARTLDLAVGK